jgi:CheY-like chemotaxis protein
MSQIHALVIDDNHSNLRVLSQLLGRQQAKCTEINNPAGLEALLPTLEPIDVVFLDLEMPGMDGYRVKDMLRAALGKTPIVAYTVHVSEMNVVRQLGFDGFIGKPVDNARFPDQLARILRGEKVWDRV